MVAGMAVLQVGDVLLLPDTEYRYGIGPVIARITEVRGQVEYRGELWWLVSGNVANGTPENRGGFIARDLYVRQASIRQTRQVPRV